MKSLSFLKTAGVLAIAMGVAAGCASNQKQTQQEEPAAPKEAPKTSSAAADAIAAAKAANKKAASVGYAWRDTGKLIKKAEEALAKGDEDKALKLANEAKAQAELAYEQYQLEQSMDRSLAPVTTGSMGNYTVVRGDSLWRISGKSEVYGNPYQWPLIYKANASKIKDADLIYPGQNFDYNTNPSSSEVDAAVNHAKTRGAWSIGSVEASDKAYLAR